MILSLNSKDIKFTKQETQNKMISIQD